MTICSGSSRHLQARWEQGPAPMSEEGGQHGAELSLPGEGPAICLEGEGGYTHWSCTRVWRRHGDPRLRPQIGGAQVITEVMCCESGKKLVSRVSLAGHQPYPGQAVSPKEVCPPPACEGAAGHKMLQVPGTDCPTSITAKPTSASKLE